MFSLMAVNHTLIKGNLILNRTFAVGLPGEIKEAPAF